MSARPGYVWPYCRIAVYGRTAHTAIRLYKESCSYRNQLRVPDQRVGEHAPQRPLMGRNAVHRARQTVEETVIEILERLLDAVVFEMRVAKHVHPRLVIAREP